MTDFRSVLLKSANYECIQSMLRVIIILEIIESKQAGNASAIYEKLCVFIDKQVSKLIVGQTMTTDEGASLAQSKTHEKVRDDIADSDIQQICETLNNQLIKPYVRFN
ncbi:MAG: phage portal protein family protein, partial [Treponemataceae bacterium]